VVAVSNDFPTWKVQHEREHEALERRIKGDVRAENEAMVEGLKRHVDAALKPVGEIDTKLNEVVDINRKQLLMLEETATYRVERKLRDELETKSRVDAESARVSRKTDAEIRIMRWQWLSGVLLAIAAILSALHLAGK
jgi:hypothetical protein